MKQSRQAQGSEGGVELWGQRSTGGGGGGARGVEPVDEQRVWCELIIMGQGGMCKVPVIER